MTCVYSFPIKAGNNYQRTPTEKFKPRLLQSLKHRELSLCGNGSLDSDEQ